MPADASRIPFSARLYDMILAVSLRGCELAQSRSRRRGKSPSAPSSLNNGMAADIDRSVLQVYSLSEKTTDIQYYGECSGDACDSRRGVTGEVVDDAAQQKACLRLDVQSRRTLIATGS